MQLRPLLALAVLTAAACGDNLEPAPGEITPDGPPVPEPVARTCDEAKLEERLRAQPGVTNVEAQACGDAVEGSATCFAIDFEQPLHHDRATSSKFEQRLRLIHRGCDRPTTVADWGYENEAFFDQELTVWYRTNALWVEHRFQGGSLPTDWDWTALTIANGAGDLHNVIETFRAFYEGRWVSTGASKGGITAIYHHHAYPDDLDGTVPYVAPASRARADAEYQNYLIAALPAPCAPGVRQFQVASLTSRRPMMIERLAAYAPGYEDYYLAGSIASFDWAFWQVWGTQGCAWVPPTTATDDQFWNFFRTFSGLDTIDQPSSLPEVEPDPERSDSALSYEWMTEQGFADQIGSHVRDMLPEDVKLGQDAGFRLQWPDVELPEYDNSTNDVVRAWMATDAKNVLMIYGEYDPWSGGMMPQPTQDTSALFVVPRASHGADISSLTGTARTTAIAHATRMYGEPPTGGTVAASARQDAILRRFHGLEVQRRVREAVATRSRR